MGIQSFHNSFCAMVWIFAIVWYEAIKKMLNVVAAGFWGLVPTNQNWPMPWKLRMTTTMMMLTMCLQMWMGKPWVMGWVAPPTWVQMPSPTIWITHHALFQATYAGLGYFKWILQRSIANNQNSLSVGTWEGSITWVISVEWWEKPVNVFDSAMYCIKTIYQVPY